MAEKKKPMGDDPLAWLGEGEAEPNKAPVKRTRKRRTIRSKATKVKTEVDLIEESFAALAPQGETLATRFYERLLDQHPELKPLFKGITAKGQQKNMLASLELLVQNLCKPEILKDYLYSLTVVHVEHGGRADHYSLFAENLLAVMAEVVGDLWTIESQTAWQNTLNTVETIMLEAFESMEMNEMTNQDNTQQQLADLTGQIDAISKSMGVISFDMDGTITDINQNFLAVVGYKRKDVIGQHHRMFADAELAASAEYTEFWAKLNRGEFDSGEYKRIGNEGKEIWLQASYNPIIDLNGKPFKVVKYATDITDEKLKAADFSGQMSAIDEVMGVISFDMDGTITDINQNFLEVVGYQRQDVIGQHHRMFADAELAASAEYTEFWAKLNRGEFDAGEYKRIGNGGKEIWLQASYNPIMDLNGKPFKVVKYATDISEQKRGEFAVQSLIQAAQVGKLEQRINIEDYSGSMKTIAENINDLMDAMQSPIQETIAVSQALSQGDLTQKLDGDYQGMFGELADALNSTVDKLAETMEEINESADSISTAATEISEGNLDLSQRTESQASSLEETASSMEELTSTVRQNSDNARQANQLASSSREQAEKGGSVIKEAIQAMAEISQSSKKVTDIIGVIDEIAFQTNLLALNAAVEAARAGEQGRGFAVVASEVRNLAQRSASAAKEIKELINDSGEKVKEGSMLVDESGRTLEEIVASSKKVGDIISEIAAAGQEQTQGIEQVNKAVSQMDEMTQQNAALVEQAAAASESLDEQGRGLQRLMSFFSVDESVEATKPIAKTKVAPKKVAVKKEKPVAKKTKAATKPKPAPAVAEDDDEWDEF